MDSNQALRLDQEEMQPNSKTDLKTENNNDENNTDSSSNAEKDPYDIMVELAASYGEENN